jgi:polyisoprenyl-phosphate glycosyltransferase
MENMQMISVIVPAFNESIGVAAAHKAISRMLYERLPEMSYEIIFVDDGSSDDTFAQIEVLCVQDQHVKCVKLLNNSGAHTAIRAGLEHSSGDMAVFLACDLQDPPDIIPELVDQLKPPYDIVLAIRKKRDDGLKDKLLSRLFFKVMQKFVSDKLPGEGSSMYLMSSRVVSVLRKMDERNLTLESIFVLMNFKHTVVEYERNARELGQSKWTLAKKIKIFIDFFIAYSYTPIKFVSIMGILFSIIGFIYTFFIILRTIFVGDLASGWPALISILLIGFGITNISLGIIAEYIWRILDEARKRPKYIIEKKVNL